MSSRPIIKCWPSGTNGEVRADLDPDVALDVAFGPVMWRLRRGAEVTGEDAADLAETALRGLAPR